MMPVSFSSLAARVLAVLALAAGPVGLRHPVAQQSLTSVTVGGSTSMIGPDVAAADFTLLPPDTTAERPLNAPLLAFAHQWVGYAPGTAGEWLLYKDVVEPQGFGPADQPVLFGMNRGRDGRLVKDLGGRLVQVPMFEPFDRDDASWWDETLDEVLYARAPFAFWELGGCWNPGDPEDLSGPGNKCGHVLRGRLADAVRRAGADGVIKFAAYILPPVANSQRRRLYREAGKLDLLARALADGNTCPPALDRAGRPMRAEPAFDLRPDADAVGHDPLWYFWDSMIKPFYDSVPRDLWYLYNDDGTLKPVIVIWEMRNATRRCGLGVGPNYFNNTEGNIRPLLERIAERFRAAYGMTPFFHVASLTMKADTTLANATDLVGAVNTWIVTYRGLQRGPDGRWPKYGTPKGIYSVTPWNGRTWGVMEASAFCGLASCAGYAQILPEGGKTLIRAMEANRASAMNFIEGAADPLEGNASYRSDDKTYPYANRYLDIIREYSDPETMTIRYQAETADAYLGPSGAEVTGKSAPVPFRYGKAWGIVRLGAADGGHGWALGQTRKGESIVYRQVRLANGFYKFTARALARSADARLRLSIDGVDFPARTVAVTGKPDAYVVVALGTTFVPAGHHDLRVTFESDSIDLDWFFSRKVWPGAGSQHGLPLPTDSIGDAPGVTLSQFNELGSAPAGQPRGVTIATLTASGGSTSLELRDVGIVGAPLANAARVAIFLANGRLLGSPDGRTERTATTAGDMFLLEKTAGSPGAALADGDTVMLRTDNGRYLTLGADGPGLASSTGPTAKIVIRIREQLAATPPA